MATLLQPLCSNYSKVWSPISYACGETDWTVYVIGTSLMTFTYHWAVVSLLACLDIAGTPSCLRKYKIQPDKNIPMNLRKYAWAACVAGVNTTVVTAATCAVLWPLAKRTMMHELPSLATTLWQLVVSVAVLELVFYYVHRILHGVPFLYKHVHQHHHQWTAPCAVATFYCHPVEHFFANSLSVGLGPAIAGAHVLFFWVWSVLGISTTILAHCGYHFPFLPSSEGHDFHHSRFTNNFGAIGLLDWLHGTDVKFKNSSLYKRHFVLWEWSNVEEVLRRRKSKR